ncbi:NUDIX hydrolase [Cytobacillus dafuensis]|uniref:NUDIX hydrolase n=1 Tax=Cytobacillus dafuensis TaxID=1742359 RepID=A0A5B8Z267_CYTDA|nr:NUDIX hydrolase [Cytobacillus dafuensis]QED46353.1 NUDIX hydrolase [Cytobacillus dafuensis]
MDAVFQTERAVFNFRVAGIWIVDHHVLLHRNVDDVYWALPGGRVVIGEDTQTSIVREFAEELGAQVTVDRLLWTNENFFTYKGKEFHELAFYYKISSEETARFFKTESFYGLEGDRWIYQWMPIDEINKIVLFPEFLKEGIKEIPDYTQHIVDRAKSSI